MLYLGLLQFDKPPERAVLVDSTKKLLDEFNDLKAVAKIIDGELKKWRTRIDAERGKVGSGKGPIEEDDKESFERQVQLEKQLSAAFETSGRALDDNIQTTNDLLDSIATSDPATVLNKLRQDFVGRDLRARLSELFVIQTQARVYLIDLNRIDLTVTEAISVALGNRLDLMNSLAQVTDTWRNTEVAGNALLAGLNLYYNGVLATDPKHLGIVKFDPADSSHAMGIRFDAPIVRRNERNTYRGSQIFYQRARRAYMLNHDEVVRTIRFDMRQLNLLRRQFEIGREQLLISARQVDQVEYLARSSTGAATGFGASAGLNLSNALNTLLTTKNSLIQNWVQYEIQRMDLYRDFDTMDIDAQGVWTNDRAIPTTPGGTGTVATVPDPVSSGRESLLPGPARVPDPVNAGAGPLVPSQPPPLPADSAGPFSKPKPKP